MNDPREDRDLGDLETRLRGLRAVEPAPGLRDRTLRAARARLRAPQKAAGWRLELAVAAGMATVLVGLGLLALPAPPLAEASPEQRALIRNLDLDRGLQAYVETRMVLSGSPPAAAPATPIPEV